MSTRPDARAYLWDIQNAAEAIARFIADTDPDAYAESDLVSAAVERKFEIIGEALGQLAKLDPELAARIPDYRAIIGFRNILIHGYAAIDHQRVLSIARTSLPALQATVGALLDRMDPLGEP